MLSHEQDSSPRRYEIAPARDQSGKARSMLGMLVVYRCALGELMKKPHIRHRVDDAVFGPHSEAGAREQALQPGVNQHTKAGVWRDDPVKHVGAIDAENAP
jgi:hypothetical protein